MAETQMKTPVEAERVEHVRARSPLEITLRRTIASARGKFGVGVILFALLVAILAPLLAPHDPVLQIAGAELHPPSASFLFGTDHLGRDIASRVIYGTRISILVGILAAALGARPCTGSARSEGARIARPFPRVDPACWPWARRGRASHAPCGDGLTRRCSASRYDESYIRCRCC